MPKTLAKTLAKYERCLSSSPMDVSDTLLESKSGAATDGAVRDRRVMDRILDRAGTSPETTRGPAARMPPRGTSAAAAHRGLSRAVDAPQLVHTELSSFLAEIQEIQGMHRTHEVDPPARGSQANGAATATTAAGAASGQLLPKGCAPAVGATKGAALASRTGAEVSEDGLLRCTLNGRASMPLLPTYLAAAADYAAAAEFAAGAALRAATAPAAAIAATAAAATAATATAGDGGSSAPPQLEIVATGHGPTHHQTPQPAPLPAPGSQAAYYTLPPGNSVRIQTTPSDYQPIRTHRPAKTPPGKKGKPTAELTIVFKQPRVAPFPSVHQVARCAACGQEKPLDDDHFSRRQKNNALDGNDARCRVCPAHLWRAEHTKEEASSSAAGRDGDGCSRGAAAATDGAAAGVASGGADGGVLGAAIRWRAVVAGGRDAQLAAEAAAKRQRVSAPTLHVPARCTCQATRDRCTCNRGAKPHVPADTRAVERPVAASNAQQQQAQPQLPPLPLVQPRPWPREQPQQPQQPRPPQQQLLQPPQQLQPRPPQELRPPQQPWLTGEPVARHQQLVHQQLVLGRGNWQYQQYQEEEEERQLQHQQHLLDLALQQQQHQQQQHQHQQQWQQYLQQQQQVQHQQLYQQQYHKQYQRQNHQRLPSYQQYQPPAERAPIAASQVACIHAAAPPHAGGAARGEAGLVQRAA